MVETDQSQPESLVIEASSRSSFADAAQLPDCADLQVQERGSFERAAVSAPSSHTATPRMAPTTSVADLSAHVPLARDDDSWADTWRAYFCAHAHRLFSTQVFAIKLLPHELDKLIIRECLGPRTAQYTAWRCSLLCSGALFFTLTVAMNVATVADPWGTGSEGDQHFLLKYVADRYHRYFDDLITLSRIQAITLLVTSCFAVLFAWLALFFWTQTVTSQIFVRSSFACSFFPPFILLLVLPFRHSVDFKGVQKQMCFDALNGTKGAFSVAENLTSTFLWPHKIGGVANQLLSTLGLHLPVGFCDRDPTTWGKEITNLLETNGFKYDPNTNSCPRGDLTVQDLLLLAAHPVAQHMVASTGASATVSTAVASAAAVTLGAGTASAASTSQAVTCATTCSNCTTTCLPYLSKLAALSNIYSLDSLRNQSLGVVAHCTHCFSVQGGTTCARNCANVAVALSRQAVSGRPPSASKVCMKAEDLESFALMVELGTQTAYWRMLLGALYAMLAIARLLPLAFSLLLGATKGANISKSVLPYSRLPDVIGTSAAIFTFPFLFQIVVLMQNIFGNLWTLMGAILLLIAVFIKMNPRSMKAESHNDFVKEAKKYTNVTVIALILAMVAFAIAFFSSDFVRSMHRVLDDQGIHLSNSQRAKMMDRFAWIMVNTLINVLGKSLVSTVFFADGMVRMLHSFHHGEDTDPLDVQCARMKLVEDLNSFSKDLTQKAGHAVAIHPEPSKELDPEEQAKAQAFVKAFLEAYTSMSSSGHGSSGVSGSAPKSLPSVAQLAAAEALASGNAETSPRACAAAAAAAIKISSTPTGDLTDSRAVDSVPEVSTGKRISSMFSSEVRTVLQRLARKGKVQDHQVEP